MWITVMLVVLSLPAIGSTEEIGPGTDWCARVHALPPGEELVLRPGDYDGPCTIRRGGSPGLPLVIRAKDLREPPRIVYEGVTGNVLNIYASHLVIRGLQFGPTLGDVDAIRLYEGSDVTIEDSRFIGVGGIAVVATHSSVRSIVVRGNEVTRSGSTAMYFGCHDGVWCAATDIVLEHNYVHDVDARDPEIGYGIQVKLNSTAIVRDNVVVNTKGPGIMIYGATDASRVSVVERNFVAGSRTSSGILVGGGPAIVRNNVAIGSAEAGIALQDYAKREILRGIAVVHNTVYGNAKGGIVVPPDARVEATLLNNAVHAGPAATPFPVGRVGVLSLGNVDCGRAACFLRPDSWDFSPLASRPGQMLGVSLMPVDDYFGRRRGMPGTVGAIEPPGGQVAPGFKVLPGARGQRPAGREGHAGQHRSERAPVQLLPTAAPAGPPGWAGRPQSARKDPKELRD